MAGDIKKRVVVLKHWVQVADVLQSFAAGLIIEMRVP